MNDLQQQVQEAVDRLVESGAERGLQVAVYRDGEPVVDAVASVADRASRRPHVTPIASVWLDEALYFSTGQTERKAKNPSWSKATR